MSEPHFQNDALQGIDEHSREEFGSNAVKKGIQKSIEAKANLGRAVKEKPNRASVAP